jgi:K+-sensing histidine kinase KdpD
VGLTPGKLMRALKGVLPVAVSVGLILAVTALLWQLKLTDEGPRRLVYFYLFPVILIAALYNGRLAVLSTVIAILCADYVLQDPLYSLVKDNTREYGDLFVFSVLAVTATKFIRVLVRPHTSLGAESRSA